MKKRPKKKTCETPAIDTKPLRSCKSTRFYFIFSFNDIHIHVVANLDYPKGFIYIGAKMSNHVECFGNVT